MSALFAAVKMIVFDVDGTLTDGGVHLGPNGEEYKRFHIADGLGFRLAALAGVRLAIVSGRISPAVTARMKLLDAGDVMQGVENKAVAIRSLRDRHGFTAHEVAYVGEDLNDLPAFETVSVRVAVANAAVELKERADYVTKAAGGSGAARELIDAVLSAKGLYDATVAAYLKEIQA